MTEREDQFDASRSSRKRTASGGGFAAASDPQAPTPRKDASSSGGGGVGGESRPSPDASARSAAAAMRPLPTSADPTSSPSQLPPDLVPVLQPDAVYEEHYGDAYVDQLLRYLYPAGYQSMRPRSGPWKLSVLVTLLFLWLSVFIVGHCYDRGRREYRDYYGANDDGAFADADDDAVVMETRWCGSKPLYCLWLVCVWISVLSASYCSIIGYVKVRDVAVANQRSQPAGHAGGGPGVAGRSDYYVAVGGV
ncbi:hypothetical protein ACHAWF_002945, partial [Thalassiosira exigua]